MADTETQREPSRTDPLIGLIPAAGRALRLGRLPCSKEIYPLEPAAGNAPRVLCEPLLAAMVAAGVDRALVLLRAGKWDVPAYLGGGEGLAAGAAPPLAYRVLESSPDVPTTLDAAYPFVRGARVALGFPDILLRPADALRRVVERHRRGGAEVVLGLFPTRHPERADMVEIGVGGERVRRVHVKPSRAALAAAGLRYTWSLAVWGPAFTELLHDFVAAAGRRGERPAGVAGRELYPGDVLQSAIDRGLTVAGVTFPDGDSLDAGTPDDLRRALDLLRQA